MQYFDNGKFPTFFTVISKRQLKKWYRLKFDICLHQPHTLFAQNIQKACLLSSFLCNKFIILYFYCQIILRKKYATKNPYVNHKGFCVYLVLFEVVCSNLCNFCDSRTIFKIPTLSWNCRQHVWGDACAVVFNFG